MLVKLLATLTVLVANVSLGICLVLLYSLADTKESMRLLVAVSGITILCLLVLVTATLDNVSWWTKSSRTSPQNQEVATLAQPQCQRPSSGDPGTSSGSTVTPLLERRMLTSAETGDMPPSYSGLLRGEVVINCSPPCYQDAMDTSNIDEMLTASKETELI